MTEANFEKNILESLRSLPLDKKQEVADFIEYLRNKPFQVAHRGIKGLWKDFPLDITAEDINETRQEIWSSFPREFE